MTARKTFQEFTGPLRQSVTFRRTRYVSTMRAIPKMDVLMYRRNPFPTCASIVLLAAVLAAPAGADNPFGVSDQVSARDQASAPALALAASYRLDTVVVSASRAETPLGQTPVTIAQIDRAAIDERAPAFIGEMLNKIGRAHV